MRKIELDKTDIALIAFMIVFILVNVIWSIANRAPLHWDPAEHTMNTFAFYDFFVGHNNNHFLNISAYYPPFTHIVIALFLLFTGIGKSVLAVSMSMNIFLVLLIFSLYLYIKILTKNKFLALITCIIFCLAPNTYGFGRTFWLELPFTSYFISLLLCLHLSKGFKVKKYTLLVILFASAAMLTRLNGFIYLIIPGIIYVYKDFHLKRFQDWQRILLVCAAILLIVLPWYVSNWNQIIKLASFFAYTEPFEPRVVLSWENLIYNLSLIVNFQLFWIGTITAFAGLVLLYKRYKKLTQALLIYLTFNYAVYTYILNKDTKYIFPLLPLFCFAIAYVFVYAWQKRKYFLFLLPVGTLILYLIYLPIYSFGWPVDPYTSNIKYSINIPAFGYVDIFNISPSSQWIAPKYNPQKWPNHEILLKAAELLKGHTRNNIMVLINKENMNPINLGYTISELDLQQIYIEFPGGQVEPFSQEALVDYVSNFDLAIIPDHSFGSTIMREADAVQQLKDYIMAQNLPYDTFKLPDGDNVFLVRLGNN